MQFPLPARSSSRAQRRPGRKWCAIVLAAAVSSNVVLALVTNVSERLTPDDVATFQRVFGNGTPTARTYAEELTLISQVQRRVLKLVPSGTPVPEYADREPSDVLSHHTGLCFDRSRLLEKAYEWYGFPVRHVYILYPRMPSGEPVSFWRALVTPRSPSHAVSEVKTQHGWLLVDSNSEWLSVRKNGEPVDADHILEENASFTKVPAYFSESFVAIRGLYSRRGQFYRPFLPYPDVNWPDFGEALIERTTQRLSNVGWQVRRPSDFAPEVPM